MKLKESLSNSADNESESKYLLKTRAGYLDARVASKYHSHLSTRLTWGKWMMDREITAVKSFIESLSDPIRILDCPCGTGIMFPAFLSAQQKNKREFVGCDISPAMLAIAQQQTSPCLLIQGDATKLPFADNSFDIVVIFGFFHRVPPSVRQATLREAARITKHWIIGSWSVSSRAQLFKRYLLSKFKPSHQFASEPATLTAIEKEISAAGLSIEKSKQLLPILSSEILYFIRKVP